MCITDLVNLGLVPFPLFSGLRSTPREVAVTGFDPDESRCGSRKAARSSPPFEDDSVLRSPIEVVDMVLRSLTRSKGLDLWIWGGGSGWSGLVGVAGPGKEGGRICLSGVFRM
jgi:hypothetical protein